MAVVQMMRNAGSATFGELANKYFQLITAHLLIAMTRKTRSRKQSVFEGDERQQLVIFVDQN